MQSTLPNTNKGVNNREPSQRTEEQQKKTPPFLVCERKPQHKMADKNSAKLDHQYSSSPLLEQENHDNDTLLLTHSWKHVQENESAQPGTRSLSPKAGQLMHEESTLHGMVLGPHEESVEDNGRERLKRHRVEVAGRVWIPDIWGQEDLLKDWIDCSAFEASLASSGIMSARAALVNEGKRAHSTSLRIGNRC